MNCASRCYLRDLSTVSSETLSLTPNHQLKICASSLVVKWSCGASSQRTRVRYGFGRQWPTALDDENLSGA